MLITSYVLIQQRFQQQHNIGRPTIGSCCYPSLCTDACCGQPYCWYIEQSTEQPGINIRKKWRWRWRWGANVGHNTSWVWCSWSDGVGVGAGFGRMPLFTTTSGRFARVVLDNLTTWILMATKNIQLNVTEKLVLGAILASTAPMTQCMGPKDRALSAATTLIEPTHTQHFLTTRFRTLQQSQECSSSWTGYRKSLPKFLTQYTSF